VFQRNNPLAPDGAGLLPLSKKEAGDQESTQHEEDVDPEEPAPEAGDPGVVEHDREDRHAANSIGGVEVCPAAREQGGTVGCWRAAMFAYGGRTRERTDRPRARGACGRRERAGPSGSADWRRAGKIG